MSEPDKKLAEEIVLFYFQSWGQETRKRVEMLNKAVKAAGIEAEFVQEDDYAGWIGEIKEAIRAKRFRKELDAIFPLGKFEDEVEAVDLLMSKYMLSKGNS